jgi:methionine synthase II (cobalamin-independent)
MAFTPRFLTTHNGSVPQTDARSICDDIASQIDIPAWAQLPRYSFRESMYVQYSPRLPAVVLDEVNERITFNTQSDLSDALETFYDHYLAEDIDYFALQPNYATGFFAMLESLKKYPGEWAKGQVTGPISFGLTVTDQDRRASLYNEMLADTITKNVAMNARWQIRQLKQRRPQVIIFVDEPYLASFGSAFISLSRDEVISMLDEIFDAIHIEGGLGGVHCCANTDWSVLLSTRLDILNLDAYGYIENLALYPSELKTFLERDGVVTWGIVPTHEEVLQVTPEGLAQRLRAGMSLISQKAKNQGVSISRDELSQHSLISPSCGLGSTSVEIAERAMDILVKTGEILKKG